MTATVQRRKWCWSLTRKISDFVCRDDERQPKPLWEIVPISQAKFACQQNIQQTVTQLVTTPVHQANERGCSCAKRLPVPRGTLLFLHQTSLKRHNLTHKTANVSGYNEVIIAQNIVGCKSVQSQFFHLFKQPDQK